MIPPDTEYTKHKNTDNRLLPPGIAIQHNTPTLTTVLIPPDTSVQHNTMTLVTTDFVLTGEACSTCTTVCSGVWRVCHYKKCNWSLICRATRDIVEEVIEVDELDEGSMYTAAEKQDK